MPLSCHEQTPLLEWAIWNIEESTEMLREQLHLTAMEWAHLQASYRHAGALRQHVASRCLLQTLIGTFHIEKDALGKPYLLDRQQFVSISHSVQRCAVALSSQKIGVDIQEIQPKVAKLAAKFLAYSDLQEMERLPFAEQILFAAWHWAAKEAMFKCYGKGQVNFSEHLQIGQRQATPTGWTATGFLQKRDEFCTFALRGERLDSNYLCVLALLEKS